MTKHSPRWLATGDRRGPHRSPGDRGDGHTQRQDDVTRDGQSSCLDREPRVGPPRCSAIRRYTPSVASSEAVEFNGIEFRRYPDAVRRCDRAYFTPSASARDRGVESLHREIWKAAHGPIPPGNHIHHVDGDPLNNDLSNLECLSAAAHHQHHATDPVWLFDEGVRKLGLERAAEWHRSPEGRAWHREHGKQTWAERDPVGMVCEQCGSSYENVAHRGKFCSNRCKSKARRASGVDDVGRTCEGCGKTFRVSRYGRTKCCSRRCAWVVRRRAG